MNHNRFSQIRRLYCTRNELSKYIIENNEHVINKCGEDTFKDYIVHFLEKYEVSQKKLLNYNELISLSGGKPLDSESPIITTLYNFLIKNILLPDYTNNQTENNKEIDDILERAIHRMEKILSKQDEK